MMDKDRMLRAMGEFLAAIGDDSLAAESRNTPERVATAWCEDILEGYSHDTAKILLPLGAPGDCGTVLVKEIEFVSVCVHHLLPFFGKAHVAYQPGARLVGLSKVARLVDCRSRRLQIQEVLTRQIVADLMKHLKPEGAACFMEAQHLCMIIRGAAKKGSRVVTSVVAGCFEEPKRREELFRLISTRLR